MSSGVSPHPLARGSREPPQGALAADSRRVVLPPGGHGPQGTEALPALGWAHTPESLTLRMRAGAREKTDTHPNVDSGRLQAAGALRVAPYSPWIHAVFALCVEGFGTLTLIRYAWLGPAVSCEVLLSGTP